MQNTNGNRTNDVYYMGEIEPEIRALGVVGLGDAGRYMGIRGNRTGDMTLTWVRCGLTMTGANTTGTCEYKKMRISRVICVTSIY